MPDLLTASALAAAVLIISALASGLVERAPLSFPIIFLGLGVFLGEHGLGVITLDAHSGLLETIATLTLALVLFIDALKLRFDEVGNEWIIPVLVLGPGAVLTMILIAGTSALLLHTSIVASLLLGAILASTDPVVLGDVLRDTRIPRSVRRALSVEAGTNDLIVLPTVLVLIAVAHTQLGSIPEWLEFLGDLFVIGPLAGVAVGWTGAWLMSRADARFSIRREYQALYGIGLVLAAYAAGTAIGGSGFLAAFAAGIAISLSNFELCDCFMEYGEVTAEMAMLVAFVLFGALLSSMTGLIPIGTTLLFAVLVIAVARPLVMTLVLRRATASRDARLFIGWFGPRGLNSLLLALLVVHGGLPESERLLAITGAVVLVSVIVHGSSITPLATWYAQHVAKLTLPEEREGSAAGLFGVHDGKVPRITPDELAVRMEDPNPPVILDVRSRSQFTADGAQIPGSIRVRPDEIIEWATGKSRDRLVVAYCT